MQFYNPEHIIVSLRLAFSNNIIYTNFCAQLEDIMEIYTVSQASANLAQLTHKIGIHSEPIYIIGDGEKDKAVLISEKEYSGMIETLYLNSIPGLKESLIEADKEPLENCSKTLDW